MIEQPSFPKGAKFADWRPRPFRVNIDRPPASLAMSRFGASRMCRRGRADGKF